MCCRTNSSTSGWATWKRSTPILVTLQAWWLSCVPAGFLTGPGFAGMRQYLRRTADEGWIVDLTPEGHQPPMNTRFFHGNQQPICVAVFIRRGEANPDSPARVHRVAVSGTTDSEDGFTRSPDSERFRLVGLP